MRLLSFFQKKDILRNSERLFYRESGVGFMKRDGYHMLNNMLKTVFGTFILAFGTAIFVLPYNLVTGGVSGVAIVLAHLIQGVDTEIFITALSWGLFILGYFALGKGFALKTLISSIVYPIGVGLFVPLTQPDVLGGFFSLSSGEYGEISILLAAVFGGFLIGAGCAITFLGGGSTGGVDVLSFMICKQFPKLKSSKVIFIVDAVIILLGMLVVGDLVLSLLGILTAFVGALVIDKLFLGESRAFIANVFSDAYEEINKDVIRLLNRTTTIHEVTGGYTKQSRKMLMITFHMRQYNELLSIISRHDKDAFITIHSAHEINGDGWTFDRKTEE